LKSNHNQPRSRLGSPNRLRKEGAAAASARTAGAAGGVPRIGRPGQNRARSRQQLLNLPPSPSRACRFQARPTELELGPHPRITRLGRRRRQLRNIGLRELASQPTQSRRSLQPSHLRPSKGRLSRDTPPHRRAQLLIRGPRAIAPHTYPKEGPLPSLPQPGNSARPLRAQSSKPSST
jgi:hypothetical protein